MCLFAAKNHQNPVNFLSKHIHFYENLRRFTRFLPADRWVYLTHFTQSIQPHLLRRCDPAAPSVMASPLTLIFELKTRFLPQILSATCPPQADPCGGFFPKNSYFLKISRLLSGFLLLALFKLAAISTLKLLCYGILHGYYGRESQYVLFPVSGLGGPCRPSSLLCRLFRYPHRLS